MSQRQNPLFWAFGVGTWFGIRIRISWLMPVVLVSFLFQFGGRLGGILFAVLLVSVLLHEIGHILAARAMDGSGDEILLWPLGGLAFVDHSASARTQFVTAAGGPMVNALLCALLLPRVWLSGHFPGALNPLHLPFSAEEFGLVNLATDVQVLAFWLNWIGLLINLVPAYPLDGGQMLRALLTARMGGSMASEVSIRCAFVVGIVLFIVSMFFVENVWLLGLAFLMIILALLESYQLQSGEGFDESFMGYDFSQGYTSLERSEQTKQERRRGLLQRWLERRRANRLRRLEQQQQQAEQQLDAILAKVHDLGIASLTPSERRLLKRASARFRGKGNERPS